MIRKLPNEVLRLQVWGNQCKDPEHRPPTDRTLEPGMWESVCPKCGEVVLFAVLPMKIDT